MAAFLEVTCMKLAAEQELSTVVSGVFTQTGKSSIKYSPHDRGGLTGLATIEL
jgi:hypothetical protein